MPQRQRNRVNTFSQNVLPFCCVPSIGSSEMRIHALVRKRSSTSEKFTRALVFFSIDLMLTSFALPFLDRFVLLFVGSAFRFVSFPTSFALVDRLSTSFNEVDMKEHDDNKIDASIVEKRLWHHAICLQYIFDKL
jgi:hypothetical protein